MSKYYLSSEVIDLHHNNMKVLVKYSVRNMAEYEAMLLVMLSEYKDAGGNFSKLTKDFLRVQFTGEVTNEKTRIKRNTKASS